MAGAVVRGGCLDFPIPVHHSSSASGIIITAVIQNDWLTSDVSVPPGWMVGASGPGSVPCHRSHSEILPCLGL